MKLIDKKTADKMASATAAPDAQSFVTDKEAKAYMAELDSEEVFKVDPATLAEATATPEANTESERVVVPPSPLADVAVHQKPFTIDFTKTGQVFNTVINETVHVGVTAAEEERFLDSVMEDDQVFELEVQAIPGKLSFTFRSRSVDETNLIVQWGDSTHGSKMLWDMAAWLQKAYCGVQLVAINARRLAPVVINGNEDIDAVIEERILTMSQNKYDLLLEAMKVFDQKERVLKSKFINRDFTNPPG